MSVTFYFWLVVVVLITEFLLEQIAEFLNIQKSKQPLSPTIQNEFKNFDLATQKKSTAYSQTRAKFSFVSALFDLFVLFAFWFAGGFAWLDNWVRSFAFENNWEAVLHGLLYLGVLFFTRSLLSLPFQLYSVFVIEEKFGFNKTTFKTFVFDRLKGLFLAVLLGIPFLFVLLSFFTYGGSFAWLWAWAAVVVISLFLQYISPTWIMPLFNTFTPMAEGELKQKIQSYAQTNHFVLKDIYVMDGSKRSSKSNAFFTGFGKNRRIALFDTLVERHSDGELVAVLAHEVGHYKKKHILKNIGFSAMHTAVLFYLLSLFLTKQNLFQAFGVGEVSVYAGLVFFSLLYTPIALFLSVVTNIFSRRFEFEADAFASATTGKPEDLILALKNLAKDNLSNLSPHPFYVFLHYSHPPLWQRIQALRN